MFQGARGKNEYDRPALARHDRIVRVLTGIDGAIVVELFGAEIAWKTGKETRTAAGNFGGHGFLAI